MDLRDKIPRFERLETGFAIIIRLKKMEGNAGREWGKIYFSDLFGTHFNDKNANYSGCLLIVLCRREKCLIKINMIFGLIELKGIKTTSQSEYLVFVIIFN